MSAVLRTRLTVAEFLAIERKAEFKSELYKGEMYAMAGASPEHNQIKDNLIGELFGKLKGGPCRTRSSDQRVLVQATDLLTYPDILILCGPGVYDPLDEYTLVNPTAIFEILSDSTERFDRGEKFRNYQQIPSLKEYLLVAQDSPVCERFVRQADGSWAFVSFDGLAATLEFTSVPVSIPLADIYAGLEFRNPSPR